MWLLTDARNDAALSGALARLPRGSGVVFRHYHLEPDERRARFAQVRRICRARALVLVLSDSTRVARMWGADGAYGAPGALGRQTGGLRLATAHSLRELRRAGTSGANGVMLSPVFPTRSHPGSKALGALRFLLMAPAVRTPVIALGGMTRRRAGRLKIHGWAAIDGLS